MPDRLSLRTVGAACLIAGCAGMPSPAHAGFQWIAPNDAVSAPPMAAPNQAPAQQGYAASAAPDIISPVVITGQGQQATVITPSSSMPLAPMSSAPAVSAPVPLVSSSQPQPAPAQSPQDNSMVVGFAKSVPLPVALRQILPNGYAFSIDQNVDMGTLVSFQGGRPWRDTLRDTLAPVGLGMTEQGQMVTVGFASAHVLPAAPPPAPVAQAQQPMPVFQANMEPKSLNQAPVPALSMAAPMTIPAPPLSGAPALSADNTAAQQGESWSAERGETLRKVLENWSQRANVEFNWLSEYDYPLQASVAYSGNFEGAVRNLLTGFAGAHPQPVAELHSNSNLGQMVLVVQARGNTNSD